MYCIMRGTDFTFVVQKDDHVVEYVCFLTLVQAHAK